MADQQPVQPPRAVGMRGDARHRAGRPRPGMEGMGATRTRGTAVARHGQMV
ncbi:hypothetical protein WDZ11_04350 [Roseomonas mucosa]|uniref:hypothetical protein n=1 Tax=Roseomonas mucosa TaxID=207340 RepID=UPI0030D2EF15